MLLFDNKRNSILLVNYEGGSVIICTFAIIIFRLTVLSSDGHVERWRQSVFFAAIDVLLSAPKKNPKEWYIFSGLMAYQKPKSIKGFHPNMWIVIYQGKAYMNRLRSSRIVRQVLKHAKRAGLSHPLLTTTLSKSVPWLWQTEKWLLKGENHLQISHGSAYEIIHNKLTSVHKYNHLVTFQHLLNCLLKKVKLWKE